MPRARRFSLDAVFTFVLCSRKLRAQQSKGRGIAIAAGHALNLANAYVALHMLRNVHNSKLPVEIFFNGEQEFDLPSQQLFEVNGKLHLPNALASEFL